MSGYAPVNGLRMYYEIEGSGDPLVRIPPAFGFAGASPLPALARNRSVITVDLQGHGRTADIPDRPISFEQHTKDIVALLSHLGIIKADFFGESFGGVIAAMIAIRHPNIVRRVATYGATFAAPNIAVRPEVLRPSVAPTPDSRGIQPQREAYKRVAPDPHYWPTIWAKIVGVQWNGFTRDQLSSIQSPLLIALGDHDFVRLEHAVETLALIPNAELAVIPDAGHFVLFSERERVLPVIEHFLAKPDVRLPFATAESGIHLGATR